MRSGQEVPLRRWELGAGHRRVGREAARTHGCTAKTSVPGADAGPGQAASQGPQTGFHIYSKRGVKCELIDEVEVKGCMIRFVLGLEAEWDGLEEESPRD